MRKPRLAIIGAGRAGSGLAAALKPKGYSLELSGRAKTSTGLARIARRAHVILICVPDDRISVVVAALCSLPPPGVRGRIVLHTSGATGTAPLRALRRRGAKVGCLHPLVSFPPAGAGPIDLTGITFGVDGDPAALRMARALARAAGGVSFRVAPADRAAYHLAASLVANGTAALLDLGIELVSRRLRISERRARAALLPLVASVLRNVSKTGARRGLTGPVARGDLGTVARHLAALAAEDPVTGRLYRLLAHRAVAMALAAGSLDRPTAAILRRRLGSD